MLLCYYRITVTLLSIICVTITELVEKCYMYLITQKHEILTIKGFAKLKHSFTNKAKVKNMYLKQFIHTIHAVTRQKEQHK